MRRKTFKNDPGVKRDGGSTVEKDHISEFDWFAIITRLTQGHQMICV